MNKILLGDCLEKLKDLENNSIDAVVTDPPYGLSFMGKKWDYDVPSVEVWQECMRVLKPGGYLLAFAGTRTQHRMAVRIEDAGFEIRDMIAWVYGSGFPKSLNIGKAVSKVMGEDVKIGTAFKTAGEYGDRNLQDPTPINEREQFRHIPQTEEAKEWEGWGTALKPALEPITVARKSLEGTVAENCLKWGVGGINIDGCRVETDEDNRRPSAGGDNGLAGSSTFKIRERKIEDQMQHFGRFPANLIHDGSDEVVSLFPNTKSMMSDRGNINIGRMAGGSGQVEGTSTVRGHNDSGSASRFFYCAKSSKSERNKGCEGLEEKTQVEHRFGRYRCKVCGKLQLDHNPCVCDEPDLERIEVNNGNNHPTVKPIALMEYLVKLVSKENHVVLDPFAGSGSTLIACKNLNRNYIGIEREAEYVKIAEARLSVETIKQPTLL